MRKILTAGAMAVTALGALGASTTTAVAEPHGGWHGGHEWHGGRGVGWGVGAGLAGFALGAALASPHYGYGYGPYYGPGYYDGYYGGDCVGTRRVWDPYYGGYVIRRFYYAC